LLMYMSLLGKANDVNGAGRKMSGRSLHPPKP